MLKIKKINSLFSRCRILFVLSVAITSSASFGAEGNYTQQIKDLAKNSACSKYSWRSRGRAPVGYVKGVALTFARSLCRIKVTGTPPAAAHILSSASSGNTSKDALSYYKNIFASAGIHVNTAGDEAVRAIYTLGLGLGMRESSGSYCEGWDTSAGSYRSSATGEAGAFQVSYDSMVISPELRKLYQEYQITPQRCGLSVFKEGVSCRNQSILGTGAGATYQVFNKSCPAFATEYAMTLLRLQRSHFGPIIRKEAEVVPSCAALLTNVEKLVNSDSEAACTELY
ncbi:MAG: hypothetical protein ACXVCY_05890 [Pseudobdellovibrionaceae bacterium]